MTGLVVGTLSFQHEDADKSRSGRGGRTQVPQKDLSVSANLPTNTNGELMQIHGHV